MHRRPPSDLHTPLWYALIALIWIVMSDRLVEGSFSRALPQTLKGITFVAVTSVFVYFLVKRHARESRSYERQVLAAEQLRSLGELSARVAHDFNNVLMAIAAFTAVLKKRTDVSSESAKSFEQIQQALSRGKTMVRDILDFSTPRPLMRSEIPVKLFLQRLITEMNSRLRDGVELTASVIPDDLTVSADKDQLHRALSNLVINAMEAIVDQGSIQIAARERTGFVVLQVLDTGPGIAPEILGKVFQPLVTTKPKGHGLGLSTVQMITIAHGGDVSCASEPGRSTTFTIKLPAR